LSRHYDDDVVFTELLQELLHLRDDLRHRVLVGSPTRLADPQHCVATFLKLIADPASMAASDGENLRLAAAVHLLTTC
jgi:hypothetical protein